MSMPYKVRVSGTGSEINVEIKPQPIATKEVYTKVITARMQGIILGAGHRKNSLAQRAILKRSLMEALLDFHKQGMIKPVEESNQ